MDMYVRSKAEEWSNCISHGIGCVAALVLAPFLAIHAFESGSTAGAVGCIVFSLSMILLYLSSSLYHGLPEGVWKDRVLQVDHGAIFLLIAGTYAPFGFQNVTPTGLVFSFAVLAFAVAGLWLAMTKRLERAWVAILMYVAMGWIGTTGAWSIVAAGDPSAKLWLIAGGVFYTSGTVFYALGERVKYFHLVWHCFVMAGTASHSLAVWGSF